MGIGRMELKNDRMESIMKVKDSLKFKGKVKLTFKNEKTGKTRIFEYDNLFVNTGLYTIIDRLAGTDIPANKKATITYCAVGTGTDAPAAGDTELQTEIARKQIADRDPVSGDATFRTYFNTGEANATLKEVGLFGDDASGDVDSGTLFCRAAIDKEKTAAESLTIDWITTIAAVV